MINITSCQEEKRTPTIHGYMKWEGIKVDIQHDDISFHREISLINPSWNTQTGVLLSQHLLYAIRSKLPLFSEAPEKTAATLMVRGPWAFARVHFPFCLIFNWWVQLVWDSSIRGPALTKVCQKLYFRSWFLGCIGFSTYRDAYYKATRFRGQSSFFPNTA